MSCQNDALDQIFHKTRDAAYEIIERKGATYYAVGNGLLRIVEAILRNQSTVLSISNYIENYYGVDDVYLSLPAIVDRGGTERVLRCSWTHRKLKVLRIPRRSCGKSLNSSSSENLL